MNFQWGTLSFQLVLPANGIILAKLGCKGVCPRLLKQRVAGPIPVVTNP